MHLYVLRHGEAEPRGAGTSDQERALTEAGHQAMEMQAALYERAGWPVERILSSPYRRARETAEHLAPVFDGRVETDSLLASGARPDDVAELVRRYDAQHMFVVGHQPDLGRFVQHISGARVAFPVGGLVIVQTDLVRAGRGQLVGAYAPDVLSRWAPSNG